MVMWRFSPWWKKREEEEEEEEEEGETKPHPHIHPHTPPVPLLLLMPLLSPWRLPPPWLTMMIWSRVWWRWGRSVW
jgi:hypothetical protein